MLCVHLELSRLFLGEQNWWMKFRSTNDALDEEKVFGNVVDKLS